MVPVQYLSMDSCSTEGEKDEENYGELLKPFSWLTGHWIGQSGSRVCELIWGKPLSSIMQGTYLVLDSGVPSSTGRLQFVAEKDQILFMMKPLELDMLPLGGMVEPATFKLAEIEPNRALFHSVNDELFNTIEISRTGNSMTFNFKEEGRIAAGTDFFNLDLVTE